MTYRTIYPIVARMTSPYLTRPVRSRQQVLRETIAVLLDRDSYFVVDADRDGKPYLRELELGCGFNETVADIATGEYDYKNQGPCGVIRIGQGECEDVTEKVAHAVLKYLIDNDRTHDEEGYLLPCPFLDNALPDWESDVRPGRVDKEYEHEEFLEKQERQ